MQTQTVTATKEFTWSMAHVLAGHKGLCQNLHGHNYKMEVTVARISGDVIADGPSAGMVLDFKDLKTYVNTLIVEPLDHATMIDTTSNNEFEVGLWRLLVRFDKKVFVTNYRPTAENMVRSFFSKLNCEFEYRRTGYKVVKIRLYETDTSYAEIIGGV